MIVVNVIKVIYVLLLFLLAVFSYGFIDPNFPYQPPEFLHNLVYTNRGYSLGIFVLIILGLFGLYGKFLYDIQKDKLKSKQVWRLIFLTAGILLFAFPGFSNDIFNYIATAKVTYLYHENPYVVMPIEIPNEPMLAFLHAANKTALYGFSWILLTTIPHFAGMGNLILTIFAFKLFVILFYLGLNWLIWKMTKKSTLSLAFFALNPLVVIETLVSGHNDVVMMFFALLSYYFLQKRKILYSIFFILISVFIKYSTIFLLPIYLYGFYKVRKKEKVKWDKIFLLSTVSMYLIFFLSPLREEMYPWYFIWPLSFAALITPKLSKAEPLKILLRLSLKPTTSYLVAVSLAFSFGLLFRFAPFVYTREWGGITPTVKVLATWIPPMFAGFYLVAKKYVQKV